MAINDKETITNKYSEFTNENADRIKHE